MYCENGMHHLDFAGVHLLMLYWKLPTHLIKLTMFRLIYVNLSAKLSCAWQQRQAYKLLILLSKQYLLLIGGASLMATIEQSSDGATFAQDALSILIDANLSKVAINRE